MYFIQSIDSFLIKQQLNKLLDELNKDKSFEVLEFSLIEDSTKQIFEEISTYSLFSTKKIVVINESWFVNESKVKLHKEYNPILIEKILNHQNEDVIVIFTLNSDKFSKKLKIAKLTESKVKLMVLNRPTIEQKYDHIKKRLSSKQIAYDDEAIWLFLELINEDMGVLSSELKKIMSLNQKITSELVRDTINNYYNFNIFDILNAFLANDLSKFLQGWNSYIEMNPNIFGFLALLAGQLITLRNATLLNQNGLNHGEIASKLGKNPYVIKKLLVENKMVISEINDKIKVLYTLEKNIKEGLIDNKVIPEVELIKMFCN